MLPWIALLLSGSVAVGLPLPPGAPARGTVDPHRLIVVDGRTGEPIEGAEVRWVEQEPTPPDEDVLDRMDRNGARAIRDLAEIDSLALRSGHVTRSDAEGHVALPVSAARTWLTGRKGELFGCNRTLKSDTTGVDQLWLWPDADLRVRALDASGAPLCGVEVLLIVHASTDVLFGGLEWGTVIERVATDQEGSASLAHASVSIAARAASGDEDWLRWRVALGLLPSTAASEDLDAEALPLDPITLKAPPTGEIELEVRELDGPFATLQYPVLLWEADRAPYWKSPTDPGLTRPGRWLFSPAELRTSPAAGKVLFLNVGLGCRFAVRGARHAAARASQAEFAGPTKAGERVKVGLVLGTDAVVLRGRALDAAGNPLARAHLRVEFLNGPSSSRGEFANVAPEEFLTRGRWRFDSDEIGRFTVEFGAELADAGPPTLVLAELRGAQAALEARLDVQELWSIGAHDLGDVRLVLAPLVVAGVVLDAAGEPVAGAVVRSGSNLRSGIATETNARGEFELHSAAPHATFGVQVFKPGFASSHLPSVERGTKDLRIALERASKILAHVRLPPGVEPEQVGFRMECTKRLGSGEPFSRVGSVGQAGLVQYDDCAPGSYRLILTPVRTSGAKRVVIEDIEVGAGEVKDLGIIDLPGA